MFWASCLLACCFMLYVLSGLGLRLPSARPAHGDMDETKWLNFEYKLKHIESELSQHHAVVGEIRSAVEQFVDAADAPPPPAAPPPRAAAAAPPPPRRTGAGDAPQRLFSARAVARSAERAPRGDNCSVAMQSVPKVDVQMLSMYEHMNFDDVDGGVWKQGWRVEYDKAQWSPQHKLKVVIIPHSHNDPGWLKTFENYYKSQTLSIFRNIVEKLSEDTKRKFIWAEVSFLSLWWNTDATQQEKTLFQKFLKTGQIEIVTGGWVMNDEANSHWLSVAQQLTTGHQWLIDNMNVIPRNAWAIDPFGHSSSQAYLLRLANMQNSLIQRVHYRVKKELALHRQLEFHWRQLWDGKGETDMFTHLMPFYSYDVPHTCGPEPEVCCQFDFRRLPGSGMTCPWKTQPKKITLRNIEERSTKILDQWRKKAQLYQSNAVAIPLGDDFRWDRASEWDAQFNNYDMLLSYINEHEELNAEVKYGTLNDYFEAVHAETKPEKFPVLSGDFFTYADRNQHYWSGYYTSRPFYKSMERSLLAYVRAAEMITAQATGINAVTDIMSLQLRDRVEPARRYLSLFQHHDGITGTSRDDVHADYANKMHTAIKYCQSAIQQSAYYLLGQPSIHMQLQEDVYMEVDDVWRHANAVPGRITIALDVLAPTRRIVLYNALSFARYEILTLLVSTHLVRVRDRKGEQVRAQVSPVVTQGARLGVEPNKFLLTFRVVVPPMALTTYSVSMIHPESPKDEDGESLVEYATLRLYNADGVSAALPREFAVEAAAGRHEGDVAVRAGGAGGARAVAAHTGLLKAVVARDGAVTPVHMDIVEYGTQSSPDNSGAYLFMPDGAARPVQLEPHPEMALVEGPIRSALHTAQRNVLLEVLPHSSPDNSGAYLFMPDGAARPVQLEPHPEMALVEGPIRSALHTAQRNVLLEMVVTNSDSQPHAELELVSTVSLDHSRDDVEIALRFSTNIENGPEFYTDLNGMQMIKRRYLKALPLQANFYPMPAAAYIEDASTRLTLLTSTPLGMAALQPGQLEVMQDRRLTRDDNRGLLQAVTDNVPTRHTFRLLVEQANRPCQQPIAPGHPSGQLTVAAHVSSSMLLQPLIVLHYTGDEAGQAQYAPVRTPLGVDTLLASYRSHLIGQLTVAAHVSFSMLLQPLIVLHYTGEEAGQAQYAPVRTPLGVDTLLASYRSHLIGQAKDGGIIQGSGVTYQRVYLNLCYGDQRIVDFYPLGDGEVATSKVLALRPDNQFFSASLTFVHVGEPLPEGRLALCPMQIRSVFINQTLFSQQRN